MWFDSAIELGRFEMERFDIFVIGLTLAFVLAVAVFSYLRVRTVALGISMGLAVLFSMTAVVADRVGQDVVARVSLAILFIVAVFSYVHVKKQMGLQ